MYHARRCTVLLGWVVGLVAAASALLTSTEPLLSRVGAVSSGPDAAVAAAAAVLAWVALAWLALGVAVSVLEEVLIRSVSCAREAQIASLVMAVAPAFVRRTVQTSLRAGLVAGAVGSAVVGPSVALAGPGPTTAVVRAADDVQPVDWPVLDRPAHPIHRAASPSTATTLHPTSEAETGSLGPLHYRVRPGDSLWTIAADHLPRRATPAEVARAWPRWWRVNHDVVGDDPGLIRPGQVLRVPEVHR